jgi:hypothetical protein
VIIGLLPPVLLGLVLVSWFSVSVVFGLGILLIDNLERSEKLSRVLVVEVGSRSSLPLDDGGKVKRDLSRVSVVVMFRELRALVSLANGELGRVRRELDSTVTEFDVPLDGAVTPVPRTVVFAILVVETIDREEFRAVIEFGLSEPLLRTVFSLMVFDC